MGKSQRLTVQEVASACEVRPVTVLLWIRAGLLQAKKARGQWWIDREDLDAFRSRGVPR